MGNLGKVTPYIITRAINEYGSDQTLGAERQINDHPEGEIHYLNKVEYGSISLEEIEELYIDYSATEVLAEIERIRDIVQMTDADKAILLYLQKELLPERLSEMVAEHED